MKKRIGNDITFSWHIYRKDGDTQVPESFAGKDVEVKLISPLQRPVTIEDVSIATGVVTFTFRGKHQVTLGNYVAVLLENKGEDGMVTIDVVNAVTLVVHSYMEEDGDEGDVIEAEAVELTSTISAGGGGGMVQQQADWAQTDASAVDYIKNKPDLGLYLQKTDDDGHGNMSIYSPGNIVLTLTDEQGSVNQIGTFYAGGWSVSSPDGKFQTFGNSIYRGTMGFDHDSVVWEKTATQQIPAATSEKNGLMSAEDKSKLNDLPTATELAQELGDKANSADIAKVATSGSYNDLSDKPTIQELATVKQIYALDATNPDYPSRIGKYSPFDITSVFGTISIVTHYSNGTEEGLSDVQAEGFTEAQYTIDNTTYTSYYKDSKYYYLGIKVPFFIANVEQYGNDYTFGVIKFTSTQSGVFKVHSIGIEPSICTITVNGVVTQSLMSDMVAVQVNEGDVVKVITLRTDNYYVKIIGFVLEGNCGVSVFVNDAGYLIAHQDITGKADKVSNPTEGNFAALNSNGNLIDSGHKHSDYLTQHQSLTNYVQKSQTAGLLKNDGTVDTNQYLIQHQDISGKANKNEMNVVPGTGVDIDKITITLKQGMSATVLTTHQDISGKENAMPIATATGETFTAVVGNYYRLDNVGILAITLPTIVGATKLQAITFLLVCGPSALVTFVPQGSETILYQENFPLEPDTTYEVTALWNGSEWTLSRVIYE